MSVAGAGHALKLIQVEGREYEYCTNCRACAAPELDDGRLARNCTAASGIPYALAAAAATPTATPATHTTITADAAAAVLAAAAKAEAKAEAAAAKADAAAQEIKEAVEKAKQALEHKTAPDIHDATFAPEWTSFLLSLGGDVAIYLSPVSPPPLVPSPPNVLQLHLATTQPYWPKDNLNLDQTPLPVPTINGESPSMSGSRIFIRPQYPWILHELELAREEHVTELSAAYRSMGAVISGNSGIGKSMLLLVRIHFLLQPSPGKSRPTIVIYRQDGSNILTIRLKGATVTGDQTPPRLSLNDIHYAKSFDPFDRDLKDENTHFFIDLVGKELQPPALPGRRPCFTLVALSPGLVRAQHQWITKIA